MYAEWAGADRHLHAGGHAGNPRVRRSGRYQHFHLGPQHGHDLRLPRSQVRKKNNSFLFSHLIDNLSATVDTWWKCIHILIIDLQRQVVAVAQSWMAANRSLFIPPLATKKRSVPEPFGPCYKNILKNKKKKLYNGLSVVLKKIFFFVPARRDVMKGFHFFSLLLLLFTSVPRPLIDRTRAI